MRIHLGGSSRQSLVAARTALDAAVKGASAAAASELSSHLFAAADLFAGNTSLRRAITDPARDKAAKAALVTELFTKSTGTLAVSIISELAGLRWSATHHRLRGARTRQNRQVRFRIVENAHLHCPDWENTSRSSHDSGMHSLQDGPNIDP